MAINEPIYLYTCKHGYKVYDTTNVTSSMPVHYDMTDTKGGA